MTKPTTSSDAHVPDSRRGAVAIRPEPIKAIPVRHWGQGISAVAIIILVAGLAYSVGTNENMQWSVVGDYLFDRTILQGVVVTVELTVLAMFIGIVLGVIVAVMRLSKNRVLSTVSWLFIWLFRGTPVLVQVLVWFNLALIFPRLGVGGLSADTNQLITAFVAALLGLGLNEAAYMAEIVRGGILSVDPGQTEAAHALGMTHGQTLRRIVLPQAMRVIVPPTGNEVITMLKTTSIVSVIAAPELLTRAQAITSKNFTTLQMLLVASFWYVVLTTVSTYAQSHLERRFARGTARGPARTTRQRVLANLRPGRVTGGTR